MPKEAFIAAKVTVAATLFENVFGPSAGAKALPALVALSALGHLLGVAFTIRQLHPSSRNNTAFASCEL